MDLSPGIFNDSKHLEVEIFERQGKKAEIAAQNGKFALFFSADLFSFLQRLSL